MREVELIIEALKKNEFEMLSLEEGSMDSGVVIFRNGEIELKIIKDRGQWILDGEREELEKYGCWKAFDSTSEFIEKILKVSGGKNA